MKTVLKSNYYEFEIEKSKFLSYLIHIESEEEAKNEVAKIKKEHPKATHHCYAYILEDKQKSNDDGEPSGTAGIPILEIIKQHNLVNVLVVVVRYFGGIKLGAGGLIRAYAKGAKENIIRAEVVEIKSLPVYMLTFEYNYISILENYISKNKLKILDKIYDLKVTYNLLLEDDTTLDKIKDFMQGKIEIDYLENINYIYKIQTEA